MIFIYIVFFFFFFNDTATTEIYTLSLHDALPISRAFLGPGEFSGDVPISRSPALRRLRRISAPGRRAPARLPAVLRRQRGLARGLRALHRVAAQRHRPALDRMGTGPSHTRALGLARRART